MGARMRGPWSSMICWDEKCNSEGTSAKRMPCKHPRSGASPSTPANATRRKAAQRGMHGHPKEIEG
eukprot:3510875-Prymnesium_polylepis.1